MFVWALLLSVLWAKPLQLVRPTDDHSKIETVAEGIEYLRQIDAPVAVIAAVGSIHTGKSFLLNQLAQTDGATATEGFSVGYTVRAETEGIWMLRYPNKLQGKTHVLFLDTEGLFSRNASSAYDAKLFAIVTLMSSELIYNTVKFIDTHHVEALETLIRQTNLFGLRAYARHSQSKPTVLTEFLQFLIPTQLSWVVQDFIQDLEDQQPERWLASLLRDEHDEHERLSNFFKHIDCVTLPMPAGSSEVLQKLDKVDRADLDVQYLEGIATFKKRLFERAQKKPKTKGGVNVELNHQLAVDKSDSVPMTGSDLAELLIFLVDATNVEKSDGQDPPFPEVPSVAEQFTKLQLKLMKADILSIVEADINRASRASLALPVYSHNFDNELQFQTMRAKSLWNSTVNGLVANDALAKSVEDTEKDFLEELDGLVNKLKNANCDSRKMWCVEFIKGLLDSYKHRIMDVTMDKPLTDDDFNVLTTKEKNNVVNKFVECLPNEYTPCCSASRGEFLNKLKAVTDALRQENTERSGKTIEEVRLKIQKQYEDAIAKTDADLLRISHDQLVDMSNEMQIKALEEYRRQLSGYKDMSGFQMAIATLRDELGKAQENQMERWRMVCKHAAEGFMKQAEFRYKSLIRRQAPFPCRMKHLRQTIADISERLRNEYREAVVCHGTSDLDRQLERSLTTIAEEAIGKNIEAVKDLYKNLLDDLKARLAEEAGNYFWQPSFRRASVAAAFSALKKNINSDVYFREVAAADTEEMVDTVDEESLQLTAQSLVEGMLEEHGQINIAMMLRVVNASVSLAAALLASRYAAHSLFKTMVCTLVAVAAFLCIFSSWIVLIAAALSKLFKPTNAWKCLTCSLIASLTAFWLCYNYTRRPPTVSSVPVVTAHRHSLNIDTTRRKTQSTM